MHLASWITIAVTFILTACTSVTKAPAPTDSSMRAPTAVSEPPQACQKRPTDVEGALKNLQDNWNLSLKIAPNWTASVGDDSSRSGYEIYSRYAGLSFVLGVTIEQALNVLHESGVVGPQVTSGWHWEDYSRMGEAALITGRPVKEAIEYLKAVYKSSNESWNYLDYSRTASIGFISGETPETSYRILHYSYASSAFANWKNGAFSRAAEAALSSGKTAQEAAAMMNAVYKRALVVSSGWNDDDYARVARAALIAGISAEQAVDILAAVYKETIAISSGWNYRDYSRMASAAIITGKTPKEAAEALRDTWNKRAIAPNWLYADYSMAAAAALIGKAPNSTDRCMNFYRAW